jgi:Mce-associated membrane protein
VQDQQPDSSDLNTDEAAALVPEGKATRRRHRMPRQKLRQGQADDAADEAVEAETQAEPEAVTAKADEEVPPVEPVPEAAVEPEPQAQTAPEPEPAAEPVPEATAEPATAPEPEAAAEPEGEPEPVGRRSRFPWRRAKAAPASTNDGAAPEATEPEPEPEPEADSASATAESDDAESGESEHAEPEIVMVPHRPAGRKLKAAAIVAGGLFVAASAFAGATLQPYLVDRAEVQTKLDVARTAQAAITTLWTYTPDDMDKLDQRAAKYLGGDFAKDYKEYIGRIVEANKQAQISNSTQVLGAAVESLTPTEASAIIYTNSVATSPVTKGIPSLRYLSYRLQLERRDGSWLITSMTAVTSLDLTPRL